MFPAPRLPAPETVSGWQSLHTPTRDNTVDAATGATVAVGDIESLILSQPLLDHFFQLFGYLLGPIMEFRVKTLDIEVIPVVGLFEPLNFSGKSAAGDH